MFVRAATLDPGYRDVALRAARALLRSLGEEARARAILIAANSAGAPDGEGWFELYIQTYKFDFRSRGALDTALLAFGRWPDNFVIYDWLDTRETLAPSDIVRLEISESLAIRRPNLTTLSNALRNAQDLEGTDLSAPTDRLVAYLSRTPRAAGDRADRAAAWALLAVSAKRAGNPILATRRFERARLLVPGIIQFPRYHQDCLAALAQSGPQPAIPDSPPPSQRRQ